MTQPWLSTLSDLNVAITRKVSHPAVCTIEAMLPYVSGHLSGALVKNLFLKDKKKGYFLVTAHHETAVDLKTLGAALGAPSIRMADLDPIGVPAGAVTPLAVFNDSSKQVQLVLDERLKSEPLVCVHPLGPSHNEETWEMATADVIRFAEHCEHVPVWVCMTSSEKVSPVVAGSKAVPEVTKAGQNRDGLTTTRAADFALWYSEAITKGGMIRYHDISGCYILRPPTMFIWETIQTYMNKGMRKMGVKNSSFPLFVSKDALEREKEHIEGFSPEVAWVTKAGNSDLPQPIAIRPTSETIMYPSYADWIRSWRDLPLNLNQWANVVRWEFKQPTPFIRSREFLWQEGHTAHSTETEALEMVHSALDLYKKVFEELLAVPVIQGEKSENEKFAGAVTTTTIEGYIPGNGRAVQAATSHYLGDHFSKMFGIQFEDKDGKNKLALQTSWGLTTRSIGIMIMTHGDDKGLVFPPRVAETQVVIVPIPPGKVADESAYEKILAETRRVEAALMDADIRVTVDDRDKTPGFKFNHWELQGVPLRVEIGAKDLEKGQLTIVRRDNGNKKGLQYAIGSVAELIGEELEVMQKEMLERAKLALSDNIVQVRSFEEVVPALKARKLILAPWCEDKETEDEIKKKTRMEFEEDEKATGMSGAMKTLCIPLPRSGYQPPITEDVKCFWTGKPAKRWCLWGRSY